MGEEKFAAIDRSSRLAKMGSSLWAVVACILVLVWAYFRAEWWSPVLAVVALFFFIESVLHNILAMRLMLRTLKE